MAEEADEQGGTPRLRFPEYQNAGGWGKTIISDFFNLKLKPEKIDVFDNNKIITVKLYTLGVIKNERNSALTGGANYFKRRSGDFIFSKIDLLNGAFGIVPRELDGFYSSSDVPSFSFKKNRSSNFFLHFLKANYLRLSIERTGTSSTLKRVSPEKFLNLTIFTPSFDEQQKIADCLSSLDDLITAHTQKLDKLKEHKKGLMQQLFPAEGETVPKLRFPEFRGTSEWEVKTLGELVDFQSGGTPSKANAEYWNGSVPWVSAKDMKQLFLADSEDHISASAVKDGAKLVAPGALLILVRGMTLLKDVPICILRREMSFNQDVKALRPKNDFDSLFLASLLIGNKDRLLEMVTIAGHGTGKLDTDELKAMVLTLPSPAEQQRIATCLSSLDDLIAAETQKIEALKTHKRGLMQQLFPVLGEEQSA